MQVANAESSCANGKCGEPVCKAGWGNCDGDWENGCEKPTAEDKSNCGACGNVCKQVANAETSCANGKCGEPECKAGWSNCDEDWGNGCETATVEDGICTSSICGEGYSDCDENMSNGCETDLSSDVNNCNYCFNKCPITLEGGEAICSAGVCGEQCPEGSTVSPDLRSCLTPMWEIPS